MTSWKGTYPLTGYGRYFKVVGTEHREPGLRSVLGHSLAADSSAEIERTLALLPEPGNPADRYAVAVYAGNVQLGYLAREDAIQYQSVLARIVGTGYIPEVAGRIWANESSDYDFESGRESRRLFSDVSFTIPEPHMLVPVNDPPRSAYTVMPRGGSIKVMKAEDHFDVLRRFHSDKGKVAAIVTLREIEGGTPRAPKAVVQIELNEQRIGQLTPATSLKYLPAVAHLQARGLLCAAHAEITSSTVAATVELFAAKAYEVDAGFLNGAAVTLPSFQTDGARQAAAKRKGATTAGSEFEVLESSSGARLTINFATPLTPWQTREAVKLFAATGKRAGVAETPDVEPGRATAVVPTDDIDEIVGAVGAIEDSEFDLARQYIARR